MKGRFRFPIPLSVLAAACTTGCCSFCIRTPGPEFWEGVHEAYSTDRDPAFSVARLAANPAVDRRVDWLERWGGDPDLSLLNGARWRARSIRPEDYPDADEISLLEWEETGYWTNGTYATQWTTLSKILTQRGLENNRTFSFSNDDFYGSTTVLVARVHSPDGSRRDIDLAANLAEAVDTGSLASNIHDPNEKTFTLALPGLQVGDAIELSMRRVAKKPRCEGVYSDYLTFESDHPSLLQVVRITGPASMPLRSRAFRDAGPVSLEHAAHTNDLFGTITEVWLAGETPRYFAEPDMPPAYDCTARLLLSTAPDWESLSRWYARLCAPHLAATNAAMTDKVASILRDVVAQDRAKTDNETGRDEPTARPPDWETYRILPSDPSAEEEAIYDKIERIVLPVFDVREADLAEVFSLLTDLSRENDPDESVPLELRGVEFVVRLDAGSDADVPLVTIKERDVSVKDVLDLVEEQADVKYRVEDGRVAVRRREDATGETFGRMFVPAIPSSAGDHDTPDDWKATFSTLGVRWPEGSSVELVADGSGVLVRNTFPELDVLASRHGTFDPCRLPTVFVDAQGLAPLQLRADGSTVVRPADRVVPSGAAQDRELVRLLEIPGRSRSPFPPGVEVDTKAPVRALKTVVDAISGVGFLPVVPFRIAGRPFVQWDNSASAPEVEPPDEPIPGFLFFGVEAVEHAWHPFPFSDGAPFPEGRHDRHVDAAGAAKAWRAACGPGKPDPKVVVFCDPDASCGRLHELMVSLQGAGAPIGVCVWDGNVFSPVANRLHAAQKAADDSRAESAEGAELSGGDTPTAHPPESTVVQSSREAVLANGFGWAYTFQLPGASAEETEERVGKPLERAFATIEGIRNVSVRIKEGSGIAVAEFAPDSDRTATKTAVADAVEAARQSMPADAVVAGPVFSAVPRAAEPRDSTDAGAADNSDPLLPPEIGAGNLEPGTCEPANLRTRADDLPPASRAAVVRALFDFVSREVRYMGAMAESEAPGYEPHDVSLTFDNRYGVCRDKAALLVAMLRMAGIDAWPVLINVGPRKDAEVPQPYFNHAIVAADSGDPDDPYLLMDPTSETTRSLLPEYLCEMSYLVARDEGETIRETPPLPVEENMLRAHTVFTLNGDASADVTTTLSFLGVNDAAYRGYFASIPRDDIRAFFERLLRGVPGAVLTRWELHPAPEDLRKSSEPLVATVEYAVAEAARGAEGGRAAFLDLPDLAGSLAIASRVVGDLGLEKRRFPLVTDYPCGFEETVELRLPDGVSVASAPDVTFPGEAVLFQDRPTETGRHRELKLFRSRYSPEEYRSLREAREAEERADRAPILLEGEGVPRMFEGRAFGSGLQNVLARAVEPAPADDVFFESQHTTVDVSRAPEEWTVASTIRYRILTYAGLRKNGDVTFRWNPATVDMSVTNAFVVSPDKPERGVAGLLAKIAGTSEPPGTVTPIDPKLDLFEGDQEWVADAPRYPAGKITTVSFPKLAPGCTVEYTVVRRIHDRDFFSLSHDLGSLKSFGEVSVTVVGTNEIARSFRVEEPYWKTIADRFPVETNATDGATTYTVRGGGPGSQIVSEPNMPPISRLVPVLRASTQTAPERARAVAERMWELSDPAVQTNAAALARSLVATNATVREAFVALRDWCAVNLREAGPAYWALPLAALSPADATLAARYGHEADLRILQLAMARALPETLRPSFPDDTPPDGPDEGPARSRSGSRERHRILIRLYNGDWDGLPERRLDRDPEPAFPNCYDTIAVALSESRSSGCVLWDDDYLFDGATQYAPALASRNRGRIYVEAGPVVGWTPAWTTVDESPDPKASEMEPAYESMDGTFAEYDITLREDGSARVAVRIRHSGTDFEAFRKRYEQILPEERRRDAQRRVAALAQSARLVGEVETETPPEGPCVMRFEAEIPDFAVREEGRLVLRVPEPAPLSPVARTRRFPFRRTSPAFEGVTTVLRPPAGWRAVSVPASGISHVSRNDGFGARRDVWTSVGPDGELVFRGVLELERTEFGADRYERFLRATLGGRGPDAATVILERTP